MKTRGVAT